MQQSEPEDSEYIRETKGYEEEQRELETIYYLLYFMITIYCICTDLRCNRFRDKAYYLF